MVVFVAAATSWHSVDLALAGRIPWRSPAPAGKRAVAVLLWMAALASLDWRWREAIVPR
jgi:hypothetical protein